ncbi:accessory Sec system protein Asp3 [Macrococcoides caseolyticum]|uniref:accessory Sec system protein Asp3 n=1 Tax=Macrococcoides caseolyticum TaxID=69966 RepID=UPI001F1AF853|nr:accessory Sec system protein Asp3 [Macrococcus caseolyticus]MCE4957553.1 accessory Sec system protein Asp3 [Macrococcus caseolyticus]
MEDKQVEIYFEGVNDSTYMYGARVSFDGRTLIYNNALIPAGTVIHRFQMISDYDKERITPNLPMLKRGVDYAIHFDYDVDPIESVYFKLNFYKRDGSLLNAINIMQPSYSFTFPEAAHTYTIEVMSASLNELTFRKMTIKGAHQLQTQHISPCINPVERPLDIYILQEETHINYQVHYEDVSHLENVYIIRYLKEPSRINKKIKDTNRKSVVISYAPSTHALARRINCDVHIELNDDAHDVIIDAVRNHVYLLSNVTMPQIIKEVSYE